MNLVLGICAVVAALVGLGLFWWRSRVGKEIALMASVDTSGAGSVAAMAPGSIVEVKGTLRVRAPLRAEFSGQPAAYYKCEIEREETYYERDSNGRDQRRTRTTTVYTNMKYGQCLVEDQTGKVGVDFDGADVEAPQTLSEPTAPPRGGMGAVGSLLNAVVGNNDRYTRKESLLSPDIPIYVLGEVQQGGLIGKPASGSKNKHFVISHKSEEERTKSLTSTMRWILVFAVLCVVLAIGLAVAGVKVGSQKKADANSTLILRSA
jgi:hypothetical protein